MHEDCFTVKIAESKCQSDLEAAIALISIGEPNGGKKENCGEISGGGWNDHNCLEKRAFICKVKGKESGDPIIPETTTADPSPNCGSGWVEDPVCLNTLKIKFLPL